MCAKHSHHHHKSIGSVVADQLIAAATRGQDAHGHHVHEHDHDQHDHDQHDHDQHDHDHHAHTTPEEQRIIDDFIMETTMFKIPENGNLSHCYYRPAVQALLDVIKNVSDPADLYEHNQSFRHAVNKIEFEILWGVKASHKYHHAYVLLSDINDEGSKFTVLTNVNLDAVDNSSNNWHNSDLFGECQCSNCLKWRK